MPKLPMDQYKKRTRGRPTKYDLPDYIPDTPQNGFAPKVRLLCDFWNSRAFCSKSLSRSSLQIAQTRDSRQHLPRRNRKHHPLLPLLVAASFSCRTRFHHLHCSHSVGS